MLQESLGKYVAVLTILKLEHKIKQMKSQKKKSDRRGKEGKETSKRHYKEKKWERKIKKEGKGS